MILNDWDEGVRAIAKWSKVREREETFSDQECPFAWAMAIFSAASCGRVPLTQQISFHVSFADVGCLPLFAFSYRIPSKA